MVESASGTIGQTCPASSWKCIVLPLFTAFEGLLDACSLSVAFCSTHVNQIVC